MLKASMKRLIIVGLQITFIGIAGLTAAVAMIGFGLAQRLHLSLLPAAVATTALLIAVWRVARYLRQPVAAARQIWAPTLAAFFIPSLLLAIDALRVWRHVCISDPDSRLCWVEGESYIFAFFLTYIFSFLVLAVSLSLFKFRGRSSKTESASH